jgi:hypothetical protein
VHHEAATAELDPIRCWWRTSAGAVRTGSTFFLDLTCAVLENDAVQVVPDETRLGGNVIQMAPFEVIDSVRGPDLRSGQRRFFQYRYTLRVINRDLIGKDIGLPDMAIRYHVNSRLPGNAALQGRDLQYLLPPQSIRVTSVVPADAADIRDAAGEPFSGIETFRFRARLFDIAALTLVALGSLMAILAVVGLGRSVRRAPPAADRAMSRWRLVRLVDGELAALNRDVEERGWDETAVSRALAAARIAAAIALDRRVSERTAEAAAAPGDGRLVVRGARGRGTAVSVSSPVTAEDLARELARRPVDEDPPARQTLERLHTALTAFGGSQYGREPTLERAPLDAALSGTAEAVGQLRSRHTRVKAYVRSYLGTGELRDQT